MKNILMNLGAAFVYYLLFIIIMPVAHAQADKFFYKPAAIPEAFKTDRDSCVARNSNQNGYMACMTQLGWTLIESAKFNADRRECGEKFPRVSGDYIAIGNYHDCMRERGWDEEFEAAKRWRKNQIAIQQYCSSEKFSEIVKRAPCNSSKILLEHLANNSRVSEAEKALWLDFFNGLDPLNSEYREILRSGPMIYKKGYEANMRFVKRTDELRIDLIMGKITIGEFNKARKDIRMEYDSLMVRANEEVRAFLNSPAPQR
jgi:hypothetical protein